MNLKQLFKPLLFLTAAFVIASCSTDDCDLDHLEKLQGLPALKAGTFPEEDLTLNVGEKYVYSPKASSPLDIYYQWYQNGEDMCLQTLHSHSMPNVRHVQKLSWNLAMIWEKLR